MTTSAPATPRHWQFDVVLSDGEEVHVRPVVAADRALVDALLVRAAARGHASEGDGEPGPHGRAVALPTAEELVVDLPRRLSLGAHHDGELLAVACSDAVEGAGGSLVRVVADDPDQRGVLATLLLQYLAAGGREQGARRLLAEVPVASTGLAGVFRDAGYRSGEATPDGSVRLELDLLGPDEARERDDEQRERLAEARAVDRLVRPKAVAVVGASSEHGTTGHRLFMNLLAGEFDGPVFPINDQATHVASVPAYASVHDVPGEVDLAVVAVPAASVPGVVEQCGDKGVKAVLVVSDGFADAGDEGAELGRRALLAARRAGMRVVGPASLGVANLVLGLDASVAPARPPAGRVALMGQSAPLTVAALARCEEHGIGLSSWVALGDRSDLSGNDLLEYWEDDPDTDMVLMYVEGVGNPRKFARIARRVAARTPIVSVRPPGSGGAGWDDPDGLYHQAGVIPVDTVDELFDAARLLTSQPLPGGPRVAVLTDAASPGLLATHLCRGHGLDAAPLGRKVAARLASTTGAAVGERAAIGLGGDAAEGRWEQAAAVVVDDVEVDSLVVVLGSASAARATAVVDEVRRATAGTATTLLGVGLAGGLEDAFAASDAHPAVPLYSSPESAGAALGRVVRHAGWRARQAGDGPGPADVDRETARRLVAGALGPAGTGRRDLDPETGRRLLACYGIAVDETVGDLGAPSPGTDGYPAAVAVEEHPVFGAVVVLARAGVPTSLVADRAVHVTPLGGAEAAAMVGALRSSPLLLDARGGAGARALERLLVRVGQMADDLPELVGLDLNPVVVARDRIGVPSPSITVRATGPDAGPAPAPTSG